MSEKIITISVAAYNLENLIERNIKSFLGCKYRDKIELLIINDGSKDRTKEIAEKYQQEYPKIVKLINKENGGAGSTVNVGIQNATGKYFRIVDGDDWVNPEQCDKLIEKLSEIDIDMVLCNYDIYNAERGVVTSTEKVRGLNKYDENLRFEDVENNFSLVMHEVIFRTDILKENNIVLDNGFYTDIEYLLFPLPYVENFIYYDLSVYVYMIARAGQSMSVESLQKHIDDHDLVLKHLVEFYIKNEKNISGKKKKLLIDKIVTIANNQLQTILTFGDYDKVKNMLKDLHIYLQKSSKELYVAYRKNSKKAWLLTTNIGFLKFVLNYKRGR